MNWNITFIKWQCSSASKMWILKLNLKWFWFREMESGIFMRLKNIQVSALWKKNNTPNWKQTFTEGEKMARWSCNTGLVCQFPVRCRFSKVWLQPAGCVLQNGSAEGEWEVNIESRRHRVQPKRRHGRRAQFRRSRRICWRYFRGR